MLSVILWWIPFLGLITIKLLPTALPEDIYTLDYIHVYIATSDITDPCTLIVTIIFKL